MAVKASASITLSFMVDIKATYRYYKLQASTASAPSAPTTYPPSSSSGWDDAEPRYTSGSTNTLYFVDCTVFTNNSFTYSKVSVSSSYEAAKEAYNKAQNAQNTANSANSKIDNLEIGGRNLLRRSKGDSKEGLFSNFDSVGDYAEVTLSSKKTYTSRSLAKGFLLGCRDYEVGKQVTWSYDIMYTNWNFPTGSNRNEFWFGQRYTNSSVAGAQGSWRKVTAHNLPVVGSDGCELNKWFHVTKTITIPEQASSSVGSSSVIQFYNSNANVEASFTARFKNVKLEYGNKATDWAPAPEDVDEKIDDASKVATNYIDFTEGTGLVVGDMTSESLGNNVLIDSDSVDIRNGTTVNASFGTTTTIGRPNWFNVCIDNNSVDIRSGTTVNASFGSDNIELAANSATGSIQLCKQIAKLEGRTNGLYISSKHVLSLTSGPNSTLFLGSTGSPLKIGGNSINFAVGKTSLTKNSYYNIYGGRVIYSNSSGSAGTITLSETAVNFSFLEIHYGNSDYQLTTRVYSPNGKTVPLFFDYMVNSTTHQILTKKVTISKTSITTDTSYSGYGNIIDGGTIYVGTENSVKIYYVIGFE